MSSHLLIYNKVDRSCSLPIPRILFTRKRILGSCILETQTLNPQFLPSSFYYHASPLFLDQLYPFQQSCYKRWFCLEEVAINNSYRKPSFSRNSLLQKFKPISLGEMDSRRKLLKMASCRKRRKGKEVAQQCPRGNNPATSHYSCIICKNMCSIGRADVPKLCHL